MKKDSKTLIENQFYLKKSAIKRVNSFDLGKQVVGRGKFGKVFTGIDEDQAIKKVKFKAESNRLSFQEEVKIYSLLSNLEIAPKFISTLITDNNGYIVAEKMDGSLENYFENHGVELRDIKKVLKLVREMHKYIDFHGDLHLGNILFILKKNILSSREEVKFKIIDVGRSVVDVRKDNYWDSQEEGKDFDLVKLGNSIYQFMKKKDNIQQNIIKYLEDQIVHSEYQRLIRAAFLPI